jgi:hypothetical protein
MPVERNTLCHGPVKRHDCRFTLCLGGIRFRHQAFSATLRQRP